MADRTAQRGDEARNARGARPEAAERFAALERPLDAERYNYAHFRVRHVAGEARKTVRRAGVPPGERAPDFELPRVGGGTWRLAQQLNPPVLLRFGSYS
jgi:hypothetical protein